LGKGEAAILLFSNSFLWVKWVGISVLFLIIGIFLCFFPKRASSDPDTLWTKVYGYGGGRYVEQLPDEGYIIASMGADGSDADFQLIRTDSSGNAIWIRFYGTVHWDYLFSSRVTGDNGFVMAGITDMDSRGYHMYLVRTDSLGEISWTRIYGGNFRDWAWDIEETASGDFVTVGSSNVIGGND